MPNQEGSRIADVNVNSDDGAHLEALALGSGDEGCGWEMVSNRKPAAHLKALGSDDEGCGWEMVSNRKPADRKHYLYIGNLKEDVQFEGLASYVQSRAAKAGVRATLYEATNTFFNKGDHVAARVAVNIGAADLLKSRVFWPRPLYARDWNFQLYDKDGSKKVTGKQDKNTEATTSAGPQDVATPPVPQGNPVGMRCQ